MNNSEKFNTLLPRWIDAYKSAWGRTPEPIPYYQGGWVRFPGMYVSNLRLSDFEKSTETLESLGLARKGKLNKPKK